MADNETEDDEQFLYGEEDDDDDDDVTSKTEEKESKLSADAPEFTPEASEEMEDVKPDVAKELGELSNEEDEEEEDDDEDEEEEDDDDDDDDDDVKIIINEVDAEVGAYSSSYGHPVNWNFKPNAGSTPAKSSGSAAPTKGVNVDAEGTVNGVAIYEYDLDTGSEEKPWRKPGADITDYFNYGFTEDTWKQYCEKQRRLRMDISMPKKNYIHGGMPPNFPQPPDTIVLADGTVKKRAGPPPERKPEGSIDVIGGENSRVESRRRPIEDEMVHRMQEGIIPPEHRLPPGHPVRPPNMLPPMNDSHFVRPPDGPPTSIPPNINPIPRLPGMRPPFLHDNARPPPGFPHGMPPRGMPPPGFPPEMMMPHDGMMPPFDMRNGRGRGFPMHPGKMPMMPHDFAVDERLQGAMMDESGMFPGMPPPGMPFDPMMARFPPLGGREMELSLESPDKRSDEESEGSEEGGRPRRRRDRDRDRHRDRERDLERRDRDRKRDREREHRERDRDRDRERGERDKDRGERDKEREKERDKERDKDRDKDREKDRDKDREKDREKERRHHDKDREKTRREDRERPSRKERDRSRERRDKDKKRHSRTEGTQEEVSDEAEVQPKKKKSRRIKEEKPESDEPKDIVEEEQKNAAE